MLGEKQLIHAVRFAGGGENWAKVTGKADFRFLDLEIKAIGLNGAI